MANAATVAASPNAPSGTSATTGNGKTPVVAAVPFIQAAQNHEEPFYDQTLTLGVSTQDFPIARVNAYGYAKFITMLVTSTGGTGGTGGTVAEDVPFSSLINLQLQEPNGAPIMGPLSSAYHLYLINKYGGYVGFNDPKQAFWSPYVAASGAFQFLLRVPILINQRTGLGALPNQNAAAPFQFKFTLNSISNIYAGGTAPTGAAVRVRLWLEAYTQPLPSAQGVSNSVTPPSFQTTQFWSEQQYTVNGGSQEVAFTRVGNYMRQMIFIYRGTSSSRSNGESNWPDPQTFAWDTRPLSNMGRDFWKSRRYERYGYNSADGGATQAANTYNTVDNGVFPYDFCHEFDGIVGNEVGYNYLQTLASSRLSLSGNWGQAGVLTVLTNDINPVGPLVVG